MSAIVATTPLQQLITFALTFAQLADQGAQKQRSVPEAAAYNHARARAFRCAATVFGRYAHVQEAVEALHRWVWLRDGLRGQQDVAEREAYSELLRHAERLQRAELRAAVAA